MFNNWAEFSVLVEQLPVMFKQRECAIDPKLYVCLLSVDGGSHHASMSRLSGPCLSCVGDNLFFRAWQFHLPRAILSIPQVQRKFLG